MEEKILRKVEKEKPVWLQEGYFYTGQNLVFEDFKDETIISKFIAEQGEFERVEEGKVKYGSWKLPAGTKKLILKTAIRLPELSKFDGLLISLKAEGLPMFDLILIEQHLNVQRRWEVPIFDVKSEWKEIRVLFRYFQCADDISAKIDLGKIIRIEFLVSPAWTGGRTKAGELGIGKVIFYKEK